MCFGEALFGQAQASRVDTMTTTYAINTGTRVAAIRLHYINGCHGYLQQPDLLETPTTFSADIP